MFALLSFVFSNLFANTEWLSTSSLNTVRTTPYTFEQNGFLYAVGGDVTGADYEYSPINPNGSLNPWTLLNGFSYMGYDGMGMVTVDSTIYFIGGRQFEINDYAYSEYAYHATITPSGPLTSFVMESSFLNLPRAHFTTVYCNGYIYVIGGVYCDFVLSVCLVGYTGSVEYSQVSSNGSLGPWNYTSSMSYNGGMMSGGWASGSTIYAMGNLGTIEKADQNPDGTLGNWQVASDTVPDPGPLAITRDSYVYVVGNGGYNYKAVFDPTLKTIGTWVSDTRAVVVPRFNHSVAAVWPQLYVLGGQQSSDSAYTPIVEYTSDEYVLTPVAGFYGYPTSGVAPLSVNFTDTSANSPTHWSWNFGDGGTSTTQNPTHLYASVASLTSYTVQLVASNSFGVSSISQTNYIYVIDSADGQNPLLANVPSLKLFIGQSLNNAINLEDYNSGGKVSSYSIPVDFLGLGTLSGSTVNQNMYSAATADSDVYQINGLLSSSSSGNKVKYSTYKIYKLPKVGLTSGSSWDVKVANYTYNASGPVIPPSFGNAGAIIVSDTTKITATWAGNTIVHITSLQAFTGAESVDIIASTVSVPPFDDLDRERIWVYSNLLSNGTFVAAADTVVWSPLETAPGRNNMATQKWISSYTDSAGTQANGVWQFTFTNASSGIKSTPKVSNWIPMLSNQWYTIRMRVVADQPNFHQSLLFGYNNYVGTGLQTDIAANIWFGIPTVWSWQETPLLVHGISTAGYPQFQFKAGSEGNVYVDEIQVINAAPTLVDSGRYRTRINYPYGGFNTASDTTGWGEQIYPGAGSVPGISVSNGQLILNFSNTTSGLGQQGIKWTANNGLTNQGASTYSVTSGRQVGVRATLAIETGDFNSLGIILVAAFGVQTAGQQDISTPPSNLLAAAGVGVLVDGTYRTVAYSVNPYYQFQFGVRSDLPGTLTVSTVDLDTDQDDPNYGDPTLFP